MSVYQLNKLCYDLKRPENREAFREDPESYYRRYSLDEDEQAALRARDYSWLFDHGVNIYVLVVHAGLHDLRLPQLMQQMKEQYAQSAAAQGVGSRQ